MDKNREYFENDYSKHWMVQTKKYALSIYEIFFIKQVLKKKPASIFEVGIGTGYPIATTIKEKNSSIRIEGSDISGKLVELAKKNLGTEQIYHGVMKELHIEEQYDVVYCFRTSWYLTDFLKELDLMSSIMKSNGALMFDFMEKYSSYYFIYYFERWKMLFMKAVGISIDIPPKLNFYTRAEINGYLRKNNMSFKRISEKKLIGNQKEKMASKWIYVCERMK